MVLEFNEAETIVLLMRLFALFWDPLVLQLISWRSSYCPLGLCSGVLLRGCWVILPGEGMEGGGCGWDWGGMSLEKPAAARSAGRGEGELTARLDVGRVWARGRRCAEMYSLGCCLFPRRLAAHQKSVCGDGLSYCCFHPRLAVCARLPFMNESLHL